MVDERVASFLDPDHDTLPDSLEQLGFKARLAVVKEGGNNSRDIVALFSDEYLDELLSLLKTSSDLRLIEL